MTSPRSPQSQGTGVSSNSLAPNPEEVNEFHHYDDVDGAPESHHHTIGTDNNQASPGGHTHDGVNSARLDASVLPDNEALIWTGN